MGRLWLVAAVVLSTLGVAGPLYAGSDPATTQGTLPAPATGTQPEAPLVLSIRALSVGPTTFTDTGDLERVRASTGAGSSKWPPASTQVGRGVYLSVMPGCIPGVDEPYLPGQRAGRRR